MWFWFDRTVLASLSSSLVWKDYLIQIQEKNLELQAATRLKSAASYRVQSTRGGFFPEISSELQYNHGTGGRVLSGFLVSSSAASSSYSFSLNASWNLFSGFSDLAKARIAECNYQISVIKVKEVETKLRSELITQLASLQYARKNQKLLEQMSSLREKNARMIELRYQNGRENWGAVLLTKAYLEQAKWDLDEAGNEVEQKELELAQILGWEGDKKLYFDDRFPVSVPPQKEEANLQKKVEQSFVYEKAIWEEKMAESQFELARATFFPKFSLVGASNNNGREFFPDQNRWFVGATLSIPLFSGGTDFYTAKAAIENQKAFAITKQNVLPMEKLRIKQKLFSFSQAIKKQEVQRIFFEASQVREKIASEKYHAGLISFEDWDRIQNEWIQNQKEFLRAERDRNFAQANWEEAEQKGLSL